MTVDDLFKRLGHVLTEDEARKRFLKACLRWIRRGLLWITVAYVVALLAVVLAFRWIGENNLTLAFLLYLPKVGFLLPLPMLVLPSLVFHWRLGLAQLLIAPLFLAFGMGWQFRSTAPPPSQASEAPLLTVLTYNRGQHANQSLQPFKNLTRPDILVLQEAGRRAARYAAAEGYAEFNFTADEGEFTLLSRYPILSSQLFEYTVEDRQRQPMARFEIDFDGQAIAVYCVHVISPRDILKYYRRGAFLYGVIGVPFTPWGEKRKINQQFWDARIDLVREMLEEIQADSLPTVVVGDFNAPAGGYIHHLLESALSDTHEAGGSGYGYTFPGTTRNPLSLGGPWIRIDYILHDDQWKTRSSITESDRPSQHRAVASTIELLNNGADGD